MKERFGFYIRRQRVGGVPVSYLGFAALDRAKRHFAVEAHMGADPWFAADALRKMAQRIEEKFEGE